MITNRQLFLNLLAQTSDEPMMLEIEKASGVYMWDIYGKQYVDLISGISVSNIGHCHPDVVKAINSQLDKYMHLMVYGEYVQSPQVKYAELLIETIHQNTPLENASQLNSCYFTNSGSEAIEGALKLAKRHTGRSEIIAMKNAYHGSTHGSMSLMSDEYFTNNYRPLLPGVQFIEFNSFNDLSRITNKTACVVTELVRAECGVELSDEHYLKELKKVCDANGVLLIADEIQTGFGRTGSMFAFERYQIVPDILVLGKAMGGGMPLAAFVASKKVMNSFSHHPVLGHITTFGGHPVNCAAAFANLSVLKSMEINNTVSLKSKLFAEKLNHPKIKKVTNAGLLISVEFEDAATNRMIIKKCIENGVIVDWFLFAENKMRIAPPLIIDEETISYSCDIILQACND